MACKANCYNFYSYCFMIIQFHSSFIHIIDKKNIYSIESSQIFGVTLSKIWIIILMQKILFPVTNNNWRHPSLSELIPMISNTGLMDLGSEASNYNQEKYTKYLSLLERVTLLLYKLYCSYVTLLFRSL